MDVILLDKVVNLGELGDRVQVKPGYARNFLIPKGKATAATKQNIALFETQRAVLQKKLSDALTAAQQKAIKLEALACLDIEAKIGVEGKLFGSIGTRDIALAITSAGIPITRHEIRLPDNGLRTAGMHTITCQLHSAVEAKLHINIVEKI